MAFLFFKLMRNHRLPLNKQFLFCPGPVNVAENVKMAAAQLEIGHREEEFSLVLQNIISNLLTLFEIKNRELYSAVVVTGSGTAANECILSSVIGKKRLLVLSNGEFGTRLYDIAKIHTSKVKRLHFGWGEKMDLNRIEKRIQRNSVDIIAMVHHETSTGMLNPIVEIGKLAKKYKKLFIVDCVSSAGAEKIDVEKANIAFLSTSASKAISSLPGVSFVLGKKEEFEKLKDIPPRTTYLNLYKFYYYASKFSQTPNTPAVQLFYAAEQALENIIKEGVSNNRKKLKNISTRLRKGFEKLGLELLIKDSKSMSSVLTTIKLPNYLTFPVLKEKFKEYGIVVYPGKGPLTDKVFQVGNIGVLKRSDITYFLNALGKIIEAESIVYSKSNKRNLVKPNYAQI